MYNIPPTVLPRLTLAIHSSRQNGFENVRHRQVVPNLTLAGPLAALAVEAKS